MKYTFSYKLLPIVALASASNVVYAAGQGSINTYSNEFNPAISLILDGRYTDIDQTELVLPGFQLGGEAGLPEQGFALGHNELALSASVDNLFYGQTSAALAYHDGETELELEEAFIEALGLGGGFTVKAGRFFSGVGYLNGIHDHAHDFSNRPLVYDAFFGGHLVDTGVQASWVAPLDFYLNVGAAVGRGSEFPGGANDGNDKGNAFFVKTGGDIGSHSSWQVGASYYRTEFDHRESGGHDHGSHEEDAHDHGHDHDHDHGADEAHAEIEQALHDGELDVVGVDFVYKWAPNGNSRETNFKFQAEYFVRNEEGRTEFNEGENSAEALYDGEQTGYYVQAIYQFMPSWRVGVRYDGLEADNTFSEFAGSGIDQDEFLEESELASSENDITRYSVMLDYSPSHFSRLRFQYGSLDNGITDDGMFTVQYIMSMGSHGAHAF